MPSLFLDFFREDDYNTIRTNLLAYSSFHKKKHWHAHIYFTSAENTVTHSYSQNVIPALTRVTVAAEEMHPPDFNSGMVVFDSWAAAVHSFDRN